MAEKTLSNNYDGILELKNVRGVLPLSEDKFISERNKSLADFRRFEERFSIEIPLYFN